MSRPARASSTSTRIHHAQLRQGRHRLEPDPVGMRLDLGYGATGRSSTRRIPPMPPPRRCRAAGVRDDFPVTNLTSTLVSSSRRPAPRSSSPTRTGSTRVRSCSSIFHCFTRYRATYKINDMVTCRPAWSTDGTARNRPDITKDRPTACRPASRCRWNQSSYRYSVR